MIAAQRVTNLEYHVFDTKPVTVHFPSIHRWPHRQANREMWSRLLSYAWMHVRCKTPDDLTIFTWNNREFPSLLESHARRSGLNIIRVGQDQHDWKNLAKISLTRDFLRTVKTKYVMGLDADDLIITDNPARAIDHLKSANCDLLFGAEAVLWPINYSIMHQYLSVCNHNSHLRYLNSGQFVGTTEAALECYELALTYKPYTTTSDQSVLHQVYLRHYPLIRLDNYADVFAVLANACLAPSNIRLV